MSKLSANTLFHFTPREYLLDKFENGFAPRYNLEFDPILDGEFFNKHYKIINLNRKNGEQTEEKLEQYPTYIPMVSFCDIPLSNLNFHMEVYSSYGLGMKKEWADDNRLNPVMYVNENSTFFTVLSGLFIASDTFHLSLSREINDELKIVQDNGHKMESTVNMLNFYHHQHVNTKDQIVAHLKPRICKGRYKNKYENYSYYDEKEWRYVPINAKEHPLIIERKLTVQELDVLNKRLRKTAITFSANEVKYIIVNNKVDIEFVVNGLNDIKRRTRKYSDEDIHNLTTKIITREQIIEDF